MRAAPWGEERGVVVKGDGGKGEWQQERGGGRSKTVERHESSTDRAAREREREEARWRMGKKLCKTAVSYLLRCIKFPVRVPVLYKIMLMSCGPLRMAACWS